jgi:hypothetical protein
LALALADGDCVRERRSGCESCSTLCSVLGHCVAVSRPTLKPLPLGSRRRKEATTCRARRVSRVEVACQARGLWSGVTGNASKSPRAVPHVRGYLTVSGDHDTTARSSTAQNTSTHMAQKATREVSCGAVPLHVRREVACNFNFSFAVSRTACKKHRNGINTADGCSPAPPPRQGSPLATCIHLSDSSSIRRAHRATSPSLHFDLCVIHWSKCHLLRSESYCDWWKLPFLRSESNMQSTGQHELFPQQNSGKSTRRFAQRPRLH